MVIKIEGIIKKVMPTVVYNDFAKRHFWFEIDTNGFKDVVQLELWKGDCEMIDHYNLGETLIVYVDVKGKIWNKDGRDLVTNTLKCWNIEKNGVTYKPLV